MMQHVKNKAAVANRHVGGFSLIEVALSISVVTLLLALSLPTSMRFFAMQTFDETRDTLRTSLRTQQMNAFQGKHDSDFGIKFFADHYTLFQGASYGARIALEDIDQSLDGMSVSGNSEIVFAHTEGRRSTTTILVLSSGGDTDSITINEAGLIE